MWQTPVSDDAVNRERGKVNSRGEPKLSAQVKLWPTPDAHCYKAGPRGNGTGGAEMLSNTVAQLWRTPSAAVTEPKSNVTKLSGRKATDPQVGLADQVGGSLNPIWVCWLQGFPLNWFQAGGKSSQISAESQAQCPIVSACSKPLEMLKCRSKRRSRGSSSEGRS